MAESTGIVRYFGRATGRVQGVGFRWFASHAGRDLGLRGFVRNESDGSVLAEVEGEPAAVERFVEQVRRGPAHARVTGCAVEDLPAEGRLGEFAVER